METDLLVISKAKEIFFRYLIPVNEHMSFEKNDIHNMIGNRVLRIMRWANFDTLQKY